MNPDPDSRSEPSREELIALVAAQAVEIATLKARIAELERRLGLDSSNSSKPPSSDGLKKPPRVKSLREPTGRPSGGQKGHPGETLRQVEVPDAVVDHYPAVCSGCGAALTATMATAHVARQVFDLPQPQPLVVTEHRAHVCCCAACGAATRAVFPEGVAAPVQYGPRLGAVAVLHANFSAIANSLFFANEPPCSCRRNFAASDQEHWSSAHRSGPDRTALSRYLRFGRNCPGVSLASRPVDFSGRRNRVSIQGFDES